MDTFRRCVCKYIFLNDVYILLKHVVLMNKFLGDPWEEFETVHGLEVTVKFVVGVDDELRDLEVAEDVAQTTAQSDDRLGV